MHAYRQYITVTDPNHLVIGKVPFQPGQKLEIVMLAENAPGQSLDSIKALFAKTQALPQVQTLTDEDIAKEIADWFLP